MGYLDNAGLSYFWGKIKDIFAYKSDIPAASTNTPAALGTAAAGSSTAWARGDHVHAMPSASDVGAISTTHVVNSITSADISSWNNKLDDENIYIIHTEWDALLNKTVVSEPWEDVVAAGEAGKLIYLKDENSSPILVTYWPEAEDDGEIYPPELTWAITGYGRGTYEVTTIQDFFWYTDEYKLQQNQTTQIAATPSAIPSASTVTPSALGTAAVGSSSAYARADHVHPIPAAATTYSSTSTQAISGKGVASALGSYVLRQVIGASGTYGLIDNSATSITLRVKNEEVASNLYVNQTSISMSAYSAVTLSAPTVSISGVATPTQNSDAANKKYVDDAISSVASVSPYTSNPAALGTASPGSSSDYARGDHVHAMPSASDVGAIAAPSSASIGAFLTYNGSAWVATTLSAWQGGSY